MQAARSIAYYIIMCDPARSKRNEEHNYRESLGSSHALALFIIFFMFKVIRNVRMWNILMAAKLVEQYGREEVRVITDASIPRRSCGDVVADLFKTGCRTC